MDNKVLDFLADISFPLYLIHSMIGYVIISILMDRGIPYTSAWIICLGLAIPIALGIHRYIEAPVNKFGKKVSGFRGMTASTNAAS